jgi:Flp pilus assembly protein TadG
MKRLLAELLHEGSGAAATEFSILVPIMAFVLLGIIDCWSLASSAMAMRAGVSAAANYLIQGGGDTPTAQSLALSAWSSHPADASVTVSKACTCADSPVDCSSLCTGTLKPPSAFVHIVATGTWTGPYTTDFLPTSLSLSREQVIRVR